MDVLDYVLDGLEQALELERELGVRSVECDRALLTSAPAAAPVTAVPMPVPAAPAPAAAAKPAARPRSEMPAEADDAADQYDFVFLHDRPLSPGGVEMVAKIIRALGRTAETAPVIVAPPIPRAKMYVVLGGRALARYLPNKHAAPGQWTTSRSGRDVLVTYSPEYILRFGEVTPAVQRIKWEMWQSLKGLVHRLESVK